MVPKVCALETQIPSKSRKPKAERGYQEKNKKSVEKKKAENEKTRKNGKNEKKQREKHGERGNIQLCVRLHHLHLQNLTRLLPILAS